MAQRYKFSIESKRLPPSLSGEPFKTLIIFTLLYIGSIPTLAQRITYAKAKYDNNWNPYIVTTIYNNSNKTIVAVEFVVEYEYPSMWDVMRYKTTKVDVVIKPKQSKTIKYYPPKDRNYKPIRQTLDKVLFSNGTIKEY